MIGLSYDAEMWLAITALLAAVITGVRLFRISQREQAQRLRLESFRGQITTPIRVDSSSAWYSELGSMIASSSIIGKVEQQRLLRLLAAAGFKAHGSLASFVAAKLCSAILLVGLAWVALEWRHLFASMMMARFAVLGGALMIGWRLPDFILNRVIKRRRLRLKQGMPDALDLLVVCSEAGLSLNQSIDEISRQLRVSHRDVADEFAATSAEMRVLPDFGQALDNLVERTGLADLRSLIATLKQSLKFGTPLAESLRMIAGEMRAVRHARIEERAARLPVILAIPMMMFILPCVMMVVGTPVALRVMDVFKNITIFGGTP